MSSVLSLFSNKTEKWFKSSVGTPTAVQEEGWPAIASGEHVLISAPTGTGKTLAAFLLFVDQLSQLKAKGELEDSLYVLYISPLKALGNDIRENLKRPIEGIPCEEVRVAVRTGDTEAAERRAMLKRSPHILITTPESLFLLLTSKGGREMLKTTRAVILDELHAVIDSKRGAHLMLSLARLDDLCGRPVQRIALSATIHPLDMAAHYLAGEIPARIVAPVIQKKSSIQVKTVVPDMRVLPSGTIWPDIAQAVYDHCFGMRSVIAFVEGRMQAEKLAYGVNEIAGNGFARTHHGCVSKEQRLEAEQQLKSGALRLMIATSSMELGIDVGEIDLVLQIGNPITVSGVLQRLGRAGHNPGRTSYMYIFPRMVTEIVSCGMSAKVAIEGGIERAKPPENCLDLVAQHIVSMTSSREYTVDELVRILTSAYSFRGITREDVEGVLRMLSGDYEHEQDRPARPRVLYDRINGTVSGDNYSRMLAVSSGGTIPDRGRYAVTLEDGTRLGELDEEYVFEARVGDKFLLGAFSWRIKEFKKDKVIVAQASFEGARAPFWKGDGRGRAYEVGLRFGALMRGLNDANQMGKLDQALSDLLLDDNAVRNASRQVQRQIEATGCLPNDKTIVIEHFSDEAGEHQMMLHSVFGQRVNLALDMLLRYEAAQMTGMDIHSYHDDDGILLYLLGTQSIPEGLMYKIDPAGVRSRIRALLPSAPIFTITFRYNAFRALMMGVRPGGRVPLWVQRMRGAEVLSDAAKQFDHPIMIETLRECLEDFLDLDAVGEVLMGVRSGAIAVHEMHVQEPSPLALPLRRQVEAVLMYEYTPTPSSAHRATDVLLDEKQVIAPGAAQLEAQMERRIQPGDAERLHSMLMAEGDMIAGEIEAPIEWLEKLVSGGRAQYIEPGLWICAEHVDVYRAALEDGEQEAQMRVVRRCLRYRGAQTAESLSERYMIDEIRIEHVLSNLVIEGLAVYHEGFYYHAELYKRAQRATIAMRRKEVATLQPENYASLLSGSVRHAGSAADQLKQAVSKLIGAVYPAEMWENMLLPARVAGYKPRLLDDLLSQGEVFWRMSSSDKRMISFHRYEDIDWSCELVWDDQALSEEERIVMRALRQRGASFAHALTPLIGGKSALDVLMGLTEKGLVRADSYLPIRHSLQEKPARQVNVKRRARARVSAQDSGRWELMRPIAPTSMEHELADVFDRNLLLSKETVGDVKWSDALETLRIWEYTGRVRRGYYVRGLSGAQFIRTQDYEKVIAMLNSPNPDMVWLNAQDPAQAWGRILPHAGDRQFMCVQGTVVCMSAGVVVAVMERNGECLRIFDMEKAQAALAEFVRAFELKRVYPVLKNITLKTYPDGSQGILESAGFVREMRDYVIWRNAM